MTLRATCPSPPDLRPPERRDTKYTLERRAQTTSNKICPQLVISAHYPHITGRPVPSSDPTSSISPAYGRLAGSLLSWTMRRASRHRRLTTTLIDPPHAHRNRLPRRSEHPEDRETMPGLLLPTYHTNRRISMELHDQVLLHHSMDHRSGHSLPRRSSRADVLRQCTPPRRRRNLR